MKVCSIVGARPQFIKAAVVSRSLRSNRGASEVLVHTGQHYDANMSEVFFEELGITNPDYNLGVGSASHGAQTGRMLQGIEEILFKETPDWVLVYGDTNSTLAAALAAVKLGIPVAHVEAGLRSYNRQMPEEINRVVTDHVSNLLFAPTTAAVSNLSKEGISGPNVLLVGDVMYDAALFFGERSRAKSTILKRVDLSPQSYILATVHRAENTDDLDQFRMIIEGLIELSHSIPVVLPLHPRASAITRKNQIITEGLKIIEPVGYLDMVALIQNASLVCTDSGGLQKEAYFHGVRCFTLRRETEWVELVEMGCNTLWSGDEDCSLALQVRAALRSSFPSSARKQHPYGDGCAAARICAALVLP
jgi:UDP-GlcNAc3NAcA epimerase